MILYNNTGVIIVFFVSYRHILQKCQLLLYIDFDEKC